MPPFVKRGKQRVIADFFFPPVFYVQHLEQWFSLPRNTWQCLEAILVVIAEWWVLPASSGWRPGVLLNNPPCTEQHPPQRII